METFDILVVDDAFPMARALSYLLTRNGYEVRVARDGVEALEKIRERKPDLVFLDLQMPRMGGVETCRRIRENPGLSDLYIIILTAMGQDQDVEHALEAGADESVAKPFSPREILRRVGEVLRTVESQ
ncbi:MAG: response regulator [Candidatus Eisenbacteria sp.]|nr:response regulator [Candidatus Eisenbacteria bacterium]